MPKENQDAMRQGRPRTHPKRMPHVALIVETSTAFGRRLICGVGRYIRENRPWAVYVEQRSIYDPGPSWLKRWEGDGLICKAAYPELAATVQKLGVPAIDLNEQIIGQGFPIVFNDNTAIGRLAARHFLERGFSSFAFIGHPGILWADTRCIGFCREVENAGRDCEIYSPREITPHRYQLPSWDRELSHMSAWLSALPRPLGVMAANDFRALQVLDACRAANLAVPEEVAIMGVDDEDAVQAIAQPSLSSVTPNAELMGYTAARYLDQLMRGEGGVPAETYVPPVGITTRQSTDILAIDDPVVAAALRFIRERACDGIKVDDVVRQSHVSRSVLQRRFRQTLKHSVLDEIAAVRTTRIKELLLQTDLSLWDIADRVSIEHVEYLSVFFKRNTGTTLSDYRRRHHADTG